MAKKLEGQVKEEVQSENLQVMEEKETTFCPLVNRRVNIKFLPKTSYRNLNEDHVLYGGKVKGATTTLCVPKRNGVYCKVLTDKEQAFFEEYLNLPKGTMNPNKINDNYWSDEQKRLGNEVTLKKGDNIFDLSQVEQYLQYCVAKANINIVCPSQAEYDRKPLVTYEYVIIDEGKEINFKLTRQERKRNAYIQVGKLEDELDVMRYVVEAITGRRIGNGSNVEALKVHCYECIERDVDKFISIVNDDLLKTKVLIRKCLDNQTIYTKGDFYYLRDNNSPMCFGNENPTLQVAATYLASPKNKELKFMLESKLKE